MWLARSLSPPICSRALWPSERANAYTTQLNYELKSRSLPVTQQVASRDTVIVVVVVAESLIRVYIDRTSARVTLSKAAERSTANADPAARNLANISLHFNAPTTIGGIREPTDQSHALTPKVAICRLKHLIDYLHTSHRMHPGACGFDLIPAKNRSIGFGVAEMTAHIPAGWLPWFVRINSCSQRLMAREWGPQSDAFAPRDRGKSPFPGLAPKTIA